MSKFDRYAKLLFSSTSGNQGGPTSPKTSSDKGALTLHPVPEKVQGPNSPMGGGEKGRKQFYSRLNRLIEDNLRLKQ